MFKKTAACVRHSILCLVLTSPLVHAASPVPAKKSAAAVHQLIRRLAVFPFLAPQELKASSEEAWWQARDELVKTRRYLVASKQFLTKSEAFQARRELEPADAILLGKLLDAHALIAGYLEGRTFIMIAYDASNGIPLWRRELPLLLSLPVQEQLAGAARRLVRDFIASAPYQGFQIVDPVIGTPVYEEGAGKFADIDVGSATDIQPGDSAQWIRLENQSLEPLFQGGGQMQAFAEGRVVKVDQGIATVELLRIDKSRAIKEYDLIRFPREFERLQDQFAIRTGSRSSVSPELLALEAAPLEAAIKERRPLVAVASWVGSVAAFLLLAF